MSPPPPLDLVALSSALRDYWATRYAGVAFIPVLLYDHLLTLDDEVERIWPLPMRFPKILFLVNRYLVPLCLVVASVVNSIHSATPKNCLFVLEWMAFTLTFSITIVELMLVVRVLALYGHNRKILLFLVVLFILNIGGFIAIQVHVINGAIVIPGGQIIQGCAYKLPALFYVEWIPLAAFEGIVLIMTMYKVVPHRRTIPAVRILARDSLIYFSVTISFLLANLLFARFIRGLAGFWIVPSTILACIAVARMTLNIREFTNVQGNQGESYPLTTENFQTMGYITTIDQTETTALATERGPTNPTLLK